MKEVESAMVAPRNTRQRVMELDGLRGIAALWVVLYHLWGAIGKRDVDWVPSSVSEFLNAGWLGVDIFFVLSGFVITHSVANMTITPIFVPKFIIRRSIRIDPPYWAAIGLAIVFMVLKNTFFPSESVTLPSFKEVAAHIFYLQDLLGYGNISSVFWTLCLEFQFYVIFAIFYHLYSSFGLPARRRYSFFLLLGGIALCGLSPVLRFSAFDLPVSGTIFPYAYEFILGVIAYHCANGIVSYKYLVAGVVLTVGITAIFKPFFFGVVPAVTLLVIFMATEWRGISFLKIPSIQWLGKISYSLYLTHAVVGWVTISLLSNLAKNFDAHVITAGIFCAGLVVSVIFSFFFYQLIEKPSLLISQKLKNRKIFYEVGGA